MLDSHCGVCEYQRLFDRLREGTTMRIREPASVGAALLSDNLPWGMGAATRSANRTAKLIDEA